MVDQTYEALTREELVAELRLLRRQIGVGLTDRESTDARTASALEDRTSLVAERGRRIEAERIGRMKDEFLANLSHELRTPLSAIYGWAQMLTPGVSTEAELREGLEIILRNAQLQIHLIDDLLDMNRIVSGKLRLDAQRVELPVIIEECVENVRVAADTKGVRLETLIDPIAGPITGDPSRMRQVVSNLLANAVKFTPRGGKVQVVLERVNSHIELAVSDSGKGISAEFLPFVFDRFSQAESSLTMSGAGLGLGLSIVKTLVEMHGGTVRAKSAGEGKGATFIVSLPVSVIHTLHGDSNRAHPTTAVQVPFQPSPDLAGVSVMVVDDDADTLFMIINVLRQSNADVTGVDSGAKALAMLPVCRPRVLISDIGMPDQDGYSLIREIRRLPVRDGGETPAVALTAFARSEDRRHAMLEGFDIHVAKPVEPGELVAVVARLARAGWRLGHATAVTSSTEVANAFE